MCPTSFELHLSAAQTLLSNPNTSQRKQLQQLSSQRCACCICTYDLFWSSSGSSHLGLLYPLPRRLKLLAPPPGRKILMLHKVVRQRDAGCRFQSRAPCMCCRASFLFFPIMAVKPLYIFFQSLMSPLLVLSGPWESKTLFNLPHKLYLQSRRASLFLFFLFSSLERNRQHSTT